MKCPYCSSATVRRGLRKTNLGKKQLYLCKKCRKKITVEWPRMRFAKKDVTYAVKLYRSGMSAGKVKNLLEERNVSVSRWTIIKWNKKFG